MPNFYSTIAQSNAVRAFYRHSSVSRVEHRPFERFCHTDSPCPARVREMEEAHTPVALIKLVHRIGEHTTLDAEQFGARR